MPRTSMQVPYTPYKTNTNLPYYLDYRTCRPTQKRVPWLFKYNPLTLEELCSIEVDKLPKPDCWNWTIKEVGDWVEHVLGFPQYRNCFEKNYITGRKLIIVEASTLPQWKITDFKHIKVITSAIRNLLNIEQEYFARSVTLPPRKPETMFLIYKRPTGVLLERRTRTKVLQDVRYLIYRPKPPLNLWDRTNYEKSKFPKERVGLWRVRTNRQLAGCKTVVQEEVKIQVLLPRVHIIVCVKEQCIFFNTIFTICTTS